MNRQIIVAVLMLLFVACAEEARPQHTVITPQAAQEMMAEENVIILDVRTSEEFQTGHIPGAVLLPYDQIRDEAELMLTDMDQIILVYCRTGVRSNTAALTLAEMGYRSVYDFGGIMSWPGPVAG